MSTTTTRPTVASVAADVTELKALFAAYLEAHTPQAATPAAPKAAKAKAPKAGKKAKASSNGRISAASKAKGEALAAEGVDPDAIMVPAGLFGRGGEQTLTEARAKAAASDAKRAEYLAKREAGELPTKAEKGDKLDPEARKAVNKAMSEHLRSMGVVPTGSAWTAAKNGERSAKKLLALNAADGIEPKKAAPATPAESDMRTPAERKLDRKKAKAAKAPKAEAIVVVAEIDEAKVAKLVAVGFDEAKARDIVSQLV